MKVSIKILSCLHEFLSEFEFYLMATRRAQASPHQKRALRKKRASKHTFSWKPSFARKVDCDQGNVKKISFSHFLGHSLVFWQVMVCKKMCAYSHAFCAARAFGAG